MPGTTIVKGAQPVEYHDEGTFATADNSTSTNWSWFGLIDSWDAEEGVETESIRYLPSEGDTSKLEKRVNVAISEMWEGEVTYAPQDFGVLQYFTGADLGTSDSPPSLQVGEIDEDNTEYRLLLGGVGEEWTFSVAEDEVAEVSGSFLFADGQDWDANDYVDTVGGGTHASEDSSEPFTYDDLANVNLGGSSIDDAVDSLEFTVSNDLEVVKDPDSTRGTHIEAIVPVNREITVDLGLTYTNFDTAQTVRNYTAQDLTFDVGGYSFTISNVRFPSFPYEMSPEDLVGDTISSDPATTISWTSP